VFFSTSQQYANRKEQQYLSCTWIRSIVDLTDKDKSYLDILVEDNDDEDATKFKAQDTLTINIIEGKNLHNGFPESSTRLEKAFVRGILSASSDDDQYEIETDCRYLTPTGETW